MTTQRFGFWIQSLFQLEIEGIPIQKLITKAQEYGLQLLRINNDIYLSTPQLIEKNGYPVQVHQVTTIDGYILTLHRIPHGKLNPTPNLGSRPVVFLQQGTFCSSAVWVLNTAEKALAFRLADLGWDVWIGNSRGTTYSKGHVSFDPNSKEYWNFSYHEMGLYDLPANIDYILDTTGQPDLNYIGHSLGTTIFFAGMVLRPEYNAKIRFMTALAPVAFCDSALTPFALLGPLVNQIEKLCDYFKIYQFFPHNFLMDILGSTVTHPLSPIQGILPNILYLFCGVDREQVDKNLMSAFLGHVPAGISTKTLVHFGQGVKSGQFCQYNYGKESNQQIYGQFDPTDYDLTKITTKVALYYGNNDWLSSKPDVHRLADNLPNVVNKFRVPFDKFNHMDFLFAMDVPSLLYNIVEDDMRKYSNCNLN